MLKKILLLVTILPFLSMAQEKEHTEHSSHSAEGSHCFFEENSLSVGLGGAYSLHLETAGINSRVYYNIKEHICLGPEFSYFSHNDINIYDVNVVAHYIFETPIVGTYPILGANYTSEGNAQHTESAFGVVVGGGIHRNVKSLTLFSEFTHIQSTLKDNFITLGAIYTFKK